MTQRMILAYPDYLAPARKLAAVLEAPCATIKLHRFPDGESKLQLPADLPGQVVICRSLDHPNGKLIELLLAAHTARELGARHLTLVAPYLCYMRQDMAFVPGEAVSQRIIGRLLADLFDTVITVDPHLHRIDALAEVMPGTRAITLSAGALLADFLRERSGTPLLVGPDSESRQWVARIAALAGLDYVVADKQRHGDRDVDVTLPEGEVAGREVVIVDDVASTAQTLADCARLLRAAGAQTVHCMVTHALFVGDAVETLHAAGVTQVWSSDSVLHASNVVDLSALLAAAVVE